MGFAVHTAEKSSSSGHKTAAQSRSLPPITTASSEIDEPHRSPDQCACGGGCPRCQLQKKAKVGPPGDGFEHEADSVAERIVSGDTVSIHGRVGPTIHTKRSGDVSNGGESAGIDGLSSGHALPLSVQREFGPRLGHDLSGVRVHHDEAADRAASSVGARAFTLGRDLVFARGEWAPHTGEGRRLLAHELVHWVQQGGHAGRIQRTLKVDATASDEKTTAIPQMTPLLQKICPDFDVDAKSGIVTAKAGTDCAKGKFEGTATGKQKLGCCCLCTLARGPEEWRIVVTIEDAPTTDDKVRPRTVKMTPTSGPNVPDFRYWTGGKTETMQPLPNPEALGHELCGHAALLLIKAHPKDEDKNTARTFSDVHDPTVKIENALAGKDEMNLGNTPRGLAASSKHRGESLRVFVVKPFKADDATVSSAAQSVIDGAAKFSDVNPTKLIDVVGFTDSGDKDASMSKKRADEVRAKFDAKLTEKDDVDFTLSPGAGTTKIPRLQPAVDGGVGSVASVEIRLAREPAGLVNLPAGVTLPSTVTHVDPANPAVVDLVTTQGKSTGNACHDLLIKTAWT